MEHNGKEPQECLYLPTIGTGSLKSRLLRLMEVDMERQEKGKG